jgi:hypothetical protein
MVLKTPNLALPDQATLDRLHGRKSAERRRAHPLQMIASGMAMIDAASTRSSLASAIICRIPCPPRRAAIGSTVVIFDGSYCVYCRSVNPGRRHSREELNEPGDFLAAACR